MTDKEWLKEELLRELMLFNGNPNMTDYESGIASGIMTAINLTEKLDEPEITFKQAHDKLRGESILSEKSFDYYWNCINDNVEIDEPGNLLVPKQDKPVIPQFVADYIESQDDPIYEMCINYEMWGVNGDDGTTSFTEEVAEWFDDSLNVKKYYRACLDGYEVEKEPQWVVRYEDGYFSEEIKFGCGIDGDWVDEVSRAYHFTDKAKVEAVALLIGGTVEEVTE